MQIRGKGFTGIKIIVCIEVGSRFLKLLQNADRLFHVTGEVIFNGQTFTK